MDKKKAIKICKEMNKWRRHNGDEPMDMPYTPKEFGQAIDKLIEIIENGEEK